MFPLAWVWVPSSVSQNLSLGPKFDLVVSNFFPPQNQQLKMGRNKYIDETCRYFFRNFAPPTFRHLFSFFTTIETWYFNEISLKFSSFNASIKLRRTHTYIALEICYIPVWTWKKVPDVIGVKTPVNFVDVL